MRSREHIKRSVACVILSGGSSTRMGKPKALLPYKGSTFVEKLIADYAEIGCDPIVVVVGEHAESIQPFINKSGVITAVNYHPEEGQLSSLKIGLTVLSREHAGFFFTLVDHPAVKVETLREILSAWDGNPQTVVRPRYDNRGGHPVLLGKNWIEKTLHLSDSSNMRLALKENSEYIIELPVSDAGIIVNVDTPEDYTNLINTDC